MVKLTVKVKERTPGVLKGRRMNERLNTLVEGEKRARAEAAKTANAVTRRSFKYLRPTAPKRQGRSSTGRKMRQALQWQPTDSGVQFNLQKADVEAPHWILQEIGTGERATIKRGAPTGGNNPVGRPKKGATYVRTVKSQRGRVISGRLVFATGPRGSYAPPGSATGQQLFLASQVRGAPVKVRGRRQAQMTITKEIKGQHMVKKGAEKGFREYEASVLAAARRAFAGQRYRS